MASNNHRINIPIRKSYKGQKTDSSSKTNSDEVAATIALNNPLATTEKKQNTDSGSLAKSVVGNTLFLNSKKSDDEARLSGLF